LLGRHIKPVLGAVAVNLVDLFVSAGANQRDSNNFFIFSFLIKPTD
jgi:hypothetical protein